MGWHNRKLPNRFFAALRVSIAVVAIVVAGLPITGCHRQADATAAADVSASRSAPVVPAVLVRTMPIQRGVYDRREFVVAGGTTARNVYPIGFELSGKVTQVFVNDGDFVQPNQPLATLDLELFGMRVEQARIAAEQAQADAEAVREAGEAVISRTERDRAERNLVAARTQLALLAMELKKATCLAPPDFPGGVIDKRMVEPGVVVAAGQPIFSIVDASEIKLHVRVPGRIVAAIAERQTRAVVTFDALPGHKSAFPADHPSGQALVTRIDMQADPAHQFRVEISIANPTGRIRPGMLGRAHLRLPALENVTWLPVTAATRVGDHYIVWLAATLPDTPSTGPIDAADDAADGAAATGAAQPWRIPARDVQLWGADIVTPLAPPRAVMIVEGFQELFPGAPIRTHSPIRSERGD